MKKAFDANVSRAKPRVRLGAMLGSPDSSAEVEVGLSDPGATVATVEAIAQQVLAEANAHAAQEVELSSVVKSHKVARTSRPSAAEALQQALGESSGAMATAAEAPSAPTAVLEVSEPSASFGPGRVELARAEAPSDPVEPVARVAPAPKPAHAKVQVKEVAHALPPPAVTEVQTAPPPAAEPEPAERRERLKERLRAVRENPRPDPLPETVAEAGVLAVERISALQTELTKVRALNLALTQDLEAARRQAERATEEARMRMDEARRLSGEMEGRAKLLTELERELESLEGERNEALLTLQEARQALEAGEQEKVVLRGEISRRDKEIDESLAEEERLAAELESAQETMGSLRRSSDSLKTERDTLAHQVADLTRERAELLEARKALEAVHRALSQASVR